MRTGSTDTLVNAAKRLVDELPEGTSGPDVVRHWLASAKADDAARGVIWPEMTPEQQSEAGLAWSLFPNQTILQGVTFALCYRVASLRRRPQQVHLRILRAGALSRKGRSRRPSGSTQNRPPEKWGPVLAQDFSNMEWVQKGMKSRGFRGALPNPHQERKVTNFHRVLSQYMGTGAPRLLDK